MPPKTYNGSCHCGAITYTVTLPSALAPEGDGKVTKCNCSICHSHGYLNVYPKREDVVFQHDSGAQLQEYFFGQKLKAHRFCPRCGSSVMIDFLNADWERLRPFVAINVRFLEGVDLDKADYEFFDGKNLI